MILYFKQYTTIFVVNPRLCYCCRHREILSSARRFSAQDICQVDGCLHCAVVNAGQGWRVEGRQPEQVSHSEYRQGDGGGWLGAGTSSQSLLERTGNKVALM